MASAGGSTAHASSRISRPRRARALTTALLLVAVLTALLGAARADASHGRAFNLSWVRTAPDTAQFHLKIAVARDQYGGSYNTSDQHPGVGDEFIEYVGGTSLAFGDGNYAPGLTFKVLSVNKRDNWMLAEGFNNYFASHPLPTYQYAAAGAFTARSSGCCMIDGLYTGPGVFAINYAVFSLVDLAHDAESPVVNVPPVVTVDDKGVQSWKVPATDAGGQRIRYKLRTGSTNPQPPGSRIDPDTGVVEWNTTGYPLGQYQASVTVEALDANGTVVSSSDASYLVRVAPAGTNATPLWTDPTPSEQQEYSLWSGQSLDIKLRSFDPDTSDKVTIDHLGLPDGATLSTADANPAAATFHWTPKRAQAGDYLITFTADDNRAPSRGTTRTVLVHVRPNAAPTADAGTAQTANEGDTVSLDASRTSDPENDPLTYKWSRIANVGPTPALSSYSAVKPSFQTLDDGSSDFRVRVDDGHGGTATKDVHTATRNVAPSVSAADLNSYAGGAAVLTTTFTDPGVLDTHTGTIDWGDGSAPEPASVTQGAGWGSIVASHRYTAVGKYTATVTVTDDDGGTGTATAHIEVTRPPAIWANSTNDAGTFTWSGSHNRITGQVHSNGSLKVSGSDNQAGTTEYAGTLTITGGGNVVSSPQKVGVDAMPVNFDVADYAPGGKAVSAIPPGNYFDESSQCGSGTFSIAGTNKQLAPGVYYVPCKVSVSGANLSGDVTIVATGAISVSDSGHNLRPYADGLLFLTSASGNNSLHLSGTGSTFTGTSFAAKGELHVSGSNLTYNGGMFADRISFTGSSLQLNAGDSNPRPNNAVALATLVPTPQLGIDASKSQATPGDKVTYRATLANGGATLLASGLFGAQDVGDSSGSVQYYSYTLEYLSAASGKWVPLAGAGAAQPGFTPAQAAPLTTGVALTTSPMTSDGIAYGSGTDHILGTALAARSFAAWAYQARVELTPEQVNLLYDPAKVQGIRDHVHLEYAPGSAPIHTLYELGNNFAAQLRANSRDITDAKLALAPPTGDPQSFDAASSPDLARIAPGTAATVQTDYTVPALTPRADAEDTAGYLARLTAADGDVMHGAVRGSGGASLGRLFVPQTIVTSTEHVPVVGVKESGPSTLDAGSTATYDLALSNNGSARASQVQVGDALYGGGTTSVSDVPSSLDPGASHTAHATRVMPASVGGGVSDLATARWEDANGNKYGPSDDTVTTQVRSPATLKASKRATLAVDADGNGAVSEGDTLEYTVTVANKAASTATGVVFSDAVDSNTTLVPGTLQTSQGGVTGSAPIRVDLGSVPGGGSATVKFRVRIPDPLPTGVQAIRNQGTVKSNQNPEIVTDDPDAAGSVDPTLTAVQLRAPRVEPQQTATLADDADGNGKPSAGDTLEYSVTLSNRGDGIATGVKLFDTIGRHLSLIGGSVQTDSGRVVDGGSPTDTQLQVALDQMPALGEAHVKFRAKIADVLPAGVDTVSDQGYVVSNETGTARAPSDDPSRPGGADPTVTQLTLVPRLEAQKTATLLTDADGNGAVSPGDTVRYDVRIANTSGATATGVKFSDTPDTNTTIVAGSATSTQGTASIAGAAVSATVGDLPLGAEATVSFQAKLKDPLPAGVYEIANQGSVTSNERPALKTDDPNGGGAADPTVTPVVRTSSPPPALAATKTASLAVDADGNHTASPGDTLSYEVKVSNVGQGTATGVRLSDSPDPNTELLAGSVQVPGSAAATSGNGSGDGQIGVDLGNLAAGASQTLTFQVKVSDAIPAGVDRVRNQGTVESAEVAPVLTQDPGGTAVGGATETPISAPPKPVPAIRGVSPADGLAITEPTPVKATLTPPTGQTIASWCVRYALSGTTETHDIKCGTGAPSSDTLTTFDPTLLRNGSYDLTIEAKASGGGDQTRTLTVSVEAELKLGRYKTSFRDLSVPVYDLPMQVTRTYDSYDKQKGDFGIGWNAQVSNFRVESNRPLGRGGWSFQGSGCHYLLGSSFCTSTDFKDLSSHFVTVTWPDGHTEVFDFTPTAGVAGVYYDATVGFTPRRGATSTIEPIGTDTTLQYWGGGNLYESDGTTLYDPQRFKLMGKDGSVYMLSVDKGLESMQDRHGNTLTVDDTGVRVSTAGKSIAFERDAEHRITKITGPSGQTLTYTYNAAGDLASSTDGAGKTITYEYDANHNLKKLKDPAGRPFRTLIYDDAGRLTGITDGDGHTTQISTDVGARQQVVTDAAGTLTTVLTRDKFGDLTSKREIADATSRTTSYEYDSNGNPTRIVDPLQHETTSTYDGAGNVLTTTDPRGQTTTFSYDDFGQLKSAVHEDGTPIARIARNQFGDATSIDKGLGRVTSFNYDQLGNLIHANGPSGSASFIYDESGQPYRIVSPTFSALIGYDQSGRISFVNDSHNGYTDFGYDGDGDLIRRAQQPAFTVRYTYDYLGRMTSETDPLNRTRTVAYDAAGRPTTSTDRNGATTAYEYDADGRPTRRNLADGTAVTTAYDGFGRALTMENRDAKLSFAYDSADRVTSLTTSGVPGSDQPTTAIGYGYDAGGNVTSVSGPGGAAHYGYDPHGRLASLTDTDGGAFGFERDPVGRLLRLTRPNGVTTTTTWNAADQRLEVAHASTAGVIEDNTYRYQPGGFADQIVDSAGTRSLGYDGGAQLASVTGPSGQPSESYSYDSNGNRTSGSARYDNAGRLLENAGFTYGYDLEGRQLTRSDKSALGATTGFGWTADGQLRKVTQPNGSITTYRYDPLGRRIEVSGSEGTRRFAYGAEGNALAEYDGQNHLTATNTFDLGLDRPLARHVGTSAYYQLSDGLDNVVALTDATGQAVDRYRYGAFGQPVGSHDRLLNPYSFAGREWDPASSTYYFRARYYDPGTGRFLSEDPLPSELNPYSYANNSPLKYRDPTGMATLGELETTTTIRADDYEFRQWASKYVQGTLNRALSLRGVFDYAVKRLAESGPVRLIETGTALVRQVAWRLEFAVGAPLALAWAKVEETVPDALEYLDILYEYIKERIEAGGAR